MTPFRFDYYAALHAAAPRILEDARKEAAALNIPDEWRGRFGVSGSNSSAPGTLRKEVVNAIVAASSDYHPLVRIGDEIRRIVKSVYGDDFDAVTINSAEAALALSYAALLAPSQIGTGDPGRAVVVVPWERHIEHHGSYGRPVPGLYKDLFADRGASTGEFGLLGRRIPFVDLALTRLAGARYEIHGVKSYAAPLLLHVDADASGAVLEAQARRHAANLAGFVSLGYDTPGFGHPEKDPDGASKLHKQYGRLAAEFGVPYIADNAWGTPFLGTDPRPINADVILYSMDKVAGGPTAGLIIGKEVSLINIRRALGVHGERFGTVSSHGKGSHAAFDPGKEALHGTLAALRLLRDEPRRFLQPVDITWQIVEDEYSRVKGKLKPGIVINKTVNSGGAEINYQDTWDNGGFGIPVFTHEDRIARTNIYNNILADIGIVPNISDDANILINPGAGTFDNNGTVVEERLRLAVRASFLALVVLQNWSDKIVAGKR
ncbi:MAG: hypothetical protein LBR29_10255 [Methylobacteriaceae bacterium]|jgi:hypothetical protein|nr:hypothetical protein [Methylobacteriaceae bacterium]